MKKLFFILIFCFSLSYAQNIDSLLNIANNSKSKKDKIEALSQLAHFYKYKNLDSSLFFINQALDIAKKIKDYENLVDLHIKKAYLEIRSGDNNAALDDFFKALEYGKQTNNDSIIALCYHKIGNGFFFNQQFDSATTYYLKAIEIREKINDLVGIADLYNNLGAIYKSIQNDSLALLYFKKAKHFYFLAGDTSDLDPLYNNIGVVFWMRKNYDSAIYYVKKSIYLAKQKNNQYNIARRYANLSIFYRAKNDPENALKYAKMALNYFHKVKDVDNLISLYITIGSIYLLENQKDSAYHYLNLAQILAKKYNSKKNLLNSYLYLKNYFKQYEIWDSAYLYLELYKSLKDTLYNLDISKQIDELRTKYQTAKMEKELIVKDLTLKKTKTISYIFISFTTIFLLMSIWLFVIYRQKRKANIILTQQKQEILQQKEEILTQAEQLKIAFENIREQKEKIEAQAETIKLFNKKLTDSIKSAEKIQKAMLPFEENFGKYFETFIIYKPKDIVSGDFYWFSKPITQNNTTYYFAAVVDCTGHGVPGAFMSMIGMRMIGEFINEHKIISPAEVLERMDKLIISALNQKVSEDNNGMDIALLRLEKKSEKQIEFVYAGAKRDLYYFDIQEKKIMIVKGTRRNIGYGKKKNLRPFENKSQIVDKQTIFYLTTDGFADQNNVERKKFTTVRLLKTLEEIAEKPLQEQKEILEDILNKWTEGTTQRDDITIVGLKLK